MHQSQPRIALNRSTAPAPTQLTIWVVCQVLDEDVPPPERVPDDLLNEFLALALDDKVSRMRELLPRMKQRFRSAPEVGDAMSRLFFDLEKADAQFQQVLALAISAGLYDPQSA